MTGVGRESARFNPLTIDLRDQQTGGAQDSVIWLRNGGGKTTLISIFYSLLVPNASHFLGRMNGKGARLEDFLRADQLAVIVSEWDLSAIGVSRRIVGQALLVKNRELRRVFFSFFETRDFGFQNLPVLGLATPAKSLDKLKEALLDQQRQHSSMDLVIVDTHQHETQRDWEKHLTSVGLDPDLFRAHLVMNSQEGGATELFKIKTAEEFMRLFLELVFDDQSTGELEKSLNLFRDKLAQTPSYKKAIEFAEELLRHLRPFAVDAAARRALKADESLIHQELSQVCAAVAAHLASLAENEALLEKQVAEFKAAADQAEKGRTRFARYAGGYEKRAKRLRVLEAGNLLQSAREIHDREFEQLRILRAAAVLKQLTTIEAQLAARRQALDELRQEHRPALEALQHLGGELRAAWQRRLQELEANLSLTVEEVESAEGKLRSLRDSRVDLTGRKERADQQKNNAQAAIRRYEEAQRLLRNRGVLNASENGAAATLRWQADADRLQAQLSHLKVEIPSLRERLQGRRTELASLTEKLHRDEQEAAELEIHVRREERKRGDLEADALLREACESASPDLRNPFLLGQLEALRAEAELELIRLGVETAEDRRDDQSLERYGMFAPPVDVEEVLVRLVQANVTSALPVYRWLDEHRSPEEAAVLLQQQPEIYSGILIQNPSDYDRARDAVREAKVRSPIVLLQAATLLSAMTTSEAVHSVMRKSAVCFRRSKPRNHNRSLT